MIDKVEYLIWLCMSTIIANFVIRKQQALSGLKMEAETVFG